MNVVELQKLAKKIRLDTVISIHKAGSGHTGASMSVVEILTALYFGSVNGVKLMNFDPAKPQWEGRDYFALSKGHSAPALYAVLANAGFFDIAEMGYLRDSGALLQGCPSLKIPGVDAVCGVMGDGLSVALGLALSLKMNKEHNKVFCLVSDFELQKGVFWESVLHAAKHRLDNLILIMDANKPQIDLPYSAPVTMDMLREKFESFGWKVIPLFSGHDIEEVAYGIYRARMVSRQPIAIIAPTVKGKGIPFAENKGSYYGVSLSEAEVHELISNHTNHE